MRSQRAFTLIELLVVITIIGILAAIALPNYIKAKDKAKEVQVKSACHSIQVALERYHTDMEQYPLFLLGGDVEGWKKWHQRYDEPNPDLTVPSNNWVRDPLISAAYMTGYPKNPFVDNGLSVMQSTGNPTGTGGSFQVGDGDPRFGLSGDTMGNGLDHPMVFQHNLSGEDNQAENQNVETKRTIDTSLGGNASQKGFNDWDSSPAASHYIMGGRRQVTTVNGQQQISTVFTHWPGNFFYRGFPERFTLRKGWTIDEPNWFHHTSVARYMVGVYGAYTSEGYDAIRLEDRCDTCGSAMRYQLPSPFDYYDFRLTWKPQHDRSGGMPEVAGGGSETKGPWLPYDQSEEYRNSFIYGAPDGHPDAVILVLTAGEEVTAYR
ncbi:MAG: type II secretion system protein [bacterium]